VATTIQIISLWFVLDIAVVAGWATWRSGHPSA
jgi:hypothetical protein